MLLSVCVVKRCEKRDHILQMMIKGIRNSLLTTQHQTIIMESTRFFSTKSKHTHKFFVAFGWCSTFFSTKKYYSTLHIFHTIGGKASPYTNKQEKACIITKKATNSQEKTQSHHHPGAVTNTSFLLSWINFLGKQHKSILGRTFSISFVS